MRAADQKQRGGDDDKARAGDRAQDSKCRIDAEVAQADFDAIDLGGDEIADVVAQLRQSGHRDVQRLAGSFGRLLGLRRRARFPPHVF